MVNLVFRNMAAGMGNNRNGNTSLSFVFRNVRNIVQSLHQNNASSTTATNVTTTTTTTTSQSNTTTVTSSNSPTSHGSITSDQMPSVSRVSPATASSSTEESAPTHTDTLPSVQSTSSVTSDFGVGASSHSVANTSVLSTSNISSEPSSSSHYASSSSSLHNQRLSESNASPPQASSHGSPDYMAVPVGMPKHMLNSEGHDRVQYSKSSESSVKSLNNHYSETQNSDRSSRPPHNTTWSGVEDSTSYDVLRPPEQAARQTLAHHHTDNNSDAAALARVSTRRPQLVRINEL
ncbi:hypothetical protein E2C01_029730 [Portunus trituberculatus]|uniref:Uncharacterized protein n=1 Tax=Portunus trituberculatus TaxID=210409 RepID=A0A5B7ESQ9_PORTR|nr:hypothetical protein [Portunus trituberculatus]